MIYVEREPEPPCERCCFCRQPTNYWTLLPDGAKVTGDSVACCERCAMRAYHEDLPTKEQWCRRESIANHRYSAPSVPPPKSIRKRKP